MLRFLTTIEPRSKVHPMEIAGFKIDRFRELSGVLRKELQMGDFGLVKTLIKSAWSFVFQKGADRRLWRARMRACRRCMVYNHKERTCRRGDLGCGCYMPFKSRVVGSTCWSGRGWGPKESPPVKEGSQVG